MGMGNLLKKGVPSPATFPRLPADGELRPFVSKGPSFRMWLFHLHSMVIRPFSPVFPLAGFMAEALYRLSFWNFKKEWLCHRKR